MSILRNGDAFSLGKNNIDVTVLHNHIYTREKNQWLIVMDCTKGDKMRAKNKLKPFGRNEIAF